MQKVNMGTLVYNAIDWVSVKLNTPCVVFLFIDATMIVKIAGLLSILSTIIYNGIRIYKEIKNKEK